VPVASADNVLAVPLAAVFTERQPDTGQSERFVYLKKEKGLERRAVQIGVSDYFYAEVQEGLAPGEVVMLELPKEELAKLTATNLQERAEGSGRGGGSGSRLPTTGAATTARPGGGAAGVGRPAGASSTR
jgi:hypothetical protein